MASISFLPLLLYICFLSFTTAQTKKHVSTDLFNSLEELSRLVDISYCVGTTGVQQPFQCLSRCIEFPDLELVTVSHLQTLISTKTRQHPTNQNPTHPADLEHRHPPLRLMRLHSPLPHPHRQTNNPRLPRHLLNNKHNNRPLRLSPILHPLPRSRRKHHGNHNPDLRRPALRKLHRPRRLHALMAPH